MEITAGKLYKMRSGSGRPLWSHAPDEELVIPENSVIKVLEPGDIVLYLEERRYGRTSTWVKMIVGELIGYTTHGFGSTEGLLESAEDEP